MPTQSLTEQVKTIETIRLLRNYWNEQIEVAEALSDDKISIEEANKQAIALDNEYERKIKKCLKDKSNVTY